MSALAIQVHNLGKQYRIGQSAAYGTLRDRMADLVRAPARWLRRPSRAEPDTIWALKEVSFEIAHGQAVGIIGRNGAGKSTLLKILSRITAPTRGTLDLYGRVGSLLEVGTGFHPELSGRENILLNGAILGMRRAEIQRKFDEIVDFAEIEKFIDTPVKFYSSGMYMRLAFAVAAHLEPEILLVDEVLAVGDAQFQKKCLGKMGEVTQQGRTVLFVSHNLNAIEELCGRCMLFQSGQLLADSFDVRGVLNQYLHGVDNQSLQSVWQNDDRRYRNPYFHPLRLLIADEAGQPAPMPARNDAGLWVQIEAEIETLDPALTIGYAIYDEDSHLLFWSYQTDQKQADWPQLTPGRNVLRCPLPARWLNEGNYRLELIGGLHFREWLFQPGQDAPGIILSIQGGLSDSPYWMMKRPGILAPALKWCKV